MKMKQIKITTREEFDNLLAQGYEVVNSFTRFGVSRRENGEILPDYNHEYIFLKKEDDEIVVDVSSLGMFFAMQYRQIADIDGNYFEKAGNVRGHADVEMYTYAYFDPIRVPCIHVESIKSNDTPKIIQYLKAYVENEFAIYAKNNTGRNLFNIFSNVLVITESRGQIDCEVYEKGKMTIQKISELREKASKMENCFVFSFFYLYTQSDKTEYHPDFFWGCIMYDLKNQKTISFNLSSNFEESNKTSLNGANLITHCCKKIFDKSIEGVNFLSMMHVSILHITYTPLPWLFFASLYPFDYGKSKSDRDYFINIPEYFTFGVSKEINTEDSFYYNSIKKDSDGMALTQFDFNNGQKIGYQLRFDTSKGEEFIHIDFGYYCGGKMTKLLAHHKMDMSMVKSFGESMFVSILSAGFFDPEFVGILKYKLQNTAEMIKKYNVLSEPLKLIHKTEEVAKWLHDNQLCDEYDKIYFNDKGIDMKKYYKISNEYNGLFKKDKQGFIGFTAMGLMVLVRKYDGKDPKIHLIQKYLSKAPRTK